MSTSLNKDLHSVYIDGEMPESFVSQYQNIVSSNEKEKAVLEKMQKLHSLLQEDSQSMTVSDSFAEESFARLRSFLSLFIIILLQTPRKRLLLQSQL